MDRHPAVVKLASLQQESGRHGEAWASQEVDIQPECAVTVSRLRTPFAPESPGLVREVRSWIGWTPLEKTTRLGVWWFRGALREEGVLSALRSWRLGNEGIVPDNVCGPPAFFVLLFTRVWTRTNWEAVLVTACWTVEGYHTTDEAMVCRWGCADCCEPELLLCCALVPLRFSDGKASPVRIVMLGSCWLGHGDFLVMDGQCQDEFLHCGDPRWNRNGLALRSVGSGDMLLLVLS